MKLGYHLGGWSAVPPSGVSDAVRLCESAGFDSLWTSEAYGSDCLTPLAWHGAATSSLRLGTSVAQMSARTPAATAMAALTLDHLSGGRMMLGLGASGPQVVEGWYGQPYSRPLARTREYVEILRAIFARDRPLTHDGVHYPLPLPGGTGLGKALKSTVHPLRADIPVLIGAEGPKNITLAAEIADGWLPLFFSPAMDSYYRRLLADGFARPGARRSPRDFEVFAAVQVVLDDDTEAAADRLRPGMALYIGGMGSRSANFHADAVAALGYEAEVASIQRLFLAGDRAAATAAVPTRLIEEVALVGPAAKIGDELHRWEESVATSLLIVAPPSELPWIVAALF